MSFFGLFKRPPPIRDADALAEFIDAHAAFVVQKGIYEYARARAGYYAAALFREQGFLDAVEKSRWSAFPLGLAMVAELIEGILRPHAGDRHQQLEALRDLVLAIFDRYPVPAALEAQAWFNARAELSRRLGQIGLHPVKWAKDVPEPFVQEYFDLLPIHESLRQRDFPTTRNYLRITMCNIHDEFSRRADVAAVAASLRADGR